MVRRLDYYAPVVLERNGHSRAGIASASLGLLALLCFVGGLLSFAEADPGALSGPRDVMTKGLCLFSVVPGIACLLAGAAMGIIGATQQCRRRWWAWMGLLINTLALLTLLLTLSSIT